MRKFILLSGHILIFYNMRYQLARSRASLTGEICLPASKSISNRLLIIDALARGSGEISNLSDSDDTLILKDALAGNKREIDAGHAGTAMRFLTAYLSILPGEWLLTGSERMKNRPIRELVMALNSLGAGISYAGREGFPPLLIKGKKVNGGEVSIDSSVSSQFISALMMIAPSLTGGLILHLDNETVSSSYIRLTANLMGDFGIPVEFSGNSITLPEKSYHAIPYTVEPDWSAASYWYSMAAVSDGADLHLKGLNKVSYQGDAVLPGIFMQFGVATEFSSAGLQLRRVTSPSTAFNFDFTDNPDLVQTMAILCGVTDRPFHFTGTRTLKIKETDRISALDIELQKLGINISSDPEGNWISWNGCRRKIDTPVAPIETYQDHRMAMAFTPAAMCISGLVIDDPGVVSKSYPSFWEDLKIAGFEISPI